MVSIMRTNKRPCVVLSDYPIKMMAYQRFLSGLGEEAVFSFRSISANDFEGLASAKLVVCDMNIMEQFEPGALEQLKTSFPKANILFLEEDHNQITVNFSGQRDVCQLGKLAEISMIQSTLKELLMQSNTKEKKTVAKKNERVERV